MHTYILIVERTVNSILKHTARHGGTLYLSLRVDRERGMEREGGKDGMYSVESALVYVGEEEEEREGE